MTVAAGDRPRVGRNQRDVHQLRFAHHMSDFGRDVVELNGGGGNLDLVVHLADLQGVRPCLLIQLQREVCLHVLLEPRRRAYARKRPHCSRPVFSIRRRARTMPRKFEDLAVYAAPGAFVLLWSSGFIGASSASTMSSR